MSLVNIEKYRDFEKAIKKVGEGRLKAYVLEKGHKIDKFDRNMNMIRYTLQHGPYAASKVFKVASSYPCHMLYTYGRYAEEIVEIMEKKNQ